MVKNYVRGEFIFENGLSISEVLNINEAEFNQMSGTTLIVGKNNAPSHTDVDNTTCFGNGNLTNSTTGDNIVFGQDNCTATTTQGGNMIFGNQNVYGQSVAQSCLFGSFIGQASTSCIMGVRALQNITTGSYNTVIGPSNAGRYYGSSTGSVTSLSYSLLLGSDVRPLGNSETNTIVMGHSAIGHGSNTVTIGNTNVTNNYFTGALHNTGALYTGDDIDCGGDLLLGLNQKAYFGASNENSISNDGTDLVINPQESGSGVVSILGEYSQIGPTGYENLISMTDNVVSINGTISATNLSGTNTGDQDLTGYVPYSGATTTFNLGANNLIVDTTTFVVNAGTNNVAIGSSATTSGTKLAVHGVTYVTDKIAFTQSDFNEYIDSLNDGYLDYGATTGHRFNNTVNINGGNVRSIVTKTASYTILLADYTILANATSNNVTLTLPTTPTTGQIYNLKCIEDTYTCTVSGNGKNIDNESTILLIKDESITIQYDGGDWRII